MAEVNITKISQVTPEVTLFLRSLGFTNYYIIKIFDLVGEAAQALTEDNPYWLLEEFPRMGFAKVDEVARKLGVVPDSRYRAEAAVGLCMRYYAGEGHSFAPYKELCLKASEMLEVSSELIEDVLEDMVFDGRLQLANVDGSRVVYFYGYYKAECSVAGKLAAMENPPGGLKQVGGDIEALIAKAEASGGIELSSRQRDAVRNALLSGVSIITGGPGTGKTTIINALISIIEGSGMKVAVAAPTGRAAKRVMETSRHFACTVHRLLEYFYDEESRYMAFGRNHERPLEQDVIIIDEASMLDLLLTEALCEALRPGMRLVLVGDAVFFSTQKVYNVKEVKSKGDGEMKIYESITELVGRTPILKLNKIAAEKNLEFSLLAKLEMFNPAGSAKDRVGLAMIRDAEEKGLIQPGATIIEPTSGNTGIGLAMAADSLGYKVILTMPETMSLERRNLLKAYGAELVLTEGTKGMQGAVEKAEALHKEIPGSIIAGQFYNPANPQILYETTGPEIYADTEGKVDIFVAGIGTGGTLSGVGKYLKEKNPEIKIIGVEPAGSPLISQGHAGPHDLQGIGANFIPENMDRNIFDEIITVTNEEAYEMGRLMARAEGVLVGISAGAALQAAIKVGSRAENKGKNVVALLPDTGERYLSTKMFTEA